MAFSNAEIFYFFLFFLFIYFFLEGTKFYITDPCNNQSNINTKKKLDNQHLSRPLFLATTTKTAATTPRPPMKPARSEEWPEPFDSADSISKL